MKIRNMGCTVAFIAICLCGCSGSGEGSGAIESDNTQNETSLIPWIDTHAHPLGYETDCTSYACMSIAIELMDQYGVRKTILMHPPASAEDAQEEALVRTTVSYSPDRFLYGGGGNTLNALVQNGPESGAAPVGLTQRFDENFQDLVDTGEVVVFGEFASLHLSYSEQHAFEEMPADADLFLHLADLAAPLGIPLDIHMDIVETRTTTPALFTDLSSLNPAILDENVTAFENLLAHNRDAKIVLAHVGRDTTGQMSANLIDRLMTENSNLYLQIHPKYGPIHSQNTILDEYGAIRSDWLRLIESYSDRIVLGSDEFFNGVLETDSLDEVQDFLHQLPADLATEIGCTNPVFIYGLPSGC